VRSRFRKESLTKLLTVAIKSGYIDWYGERQNTFIPPQRETIMTTATLEKTALQLSIEALGSENFNVCDGHKTDIYLDPEKKAVYTFVGSNSSPMAAFNNIDLHLLRVHNGSIASSVQAAIDNVSDNIGSVLALYLGTEWNGNNHVGQWGEGLCDELECLQEKLSLTPAACYWDASEWFDPVLDDLKTEWEAGKTAEQIIDGQNLGDDCDGEVDRNEAIAWLNGMIGEWSADLSSEYDEDPNMF